eukprot:612841-Rhodomonas_salina.2
MSSASFGEADVLWSSFLESPLRILTLDVGLVCFLCRFFCGDCCVWTPTGTGITGVGRHSWIHPHCRLRRHGHVHASVISFAVSCRVIAPRSVRRGRDGVVDGPMGVSAGREARRKRPSS